MFSVVIPLYNKAGYVQKAVQSVLDQELSEFELIIINDGSTDNSLELISQYYDPRIRILNQENAGVSVARNNGVKEAIFDHIAFLDADDWWEPNYLLEIADLIRKYPQAGIWASKYYIVKNGKYLEANIGYDEGFIQGYVEYFKVYARTMWMPLTSSSFIVKKLVFEVCNGFNPQLKFGEDFNLWSRIALYNKVVFINKPLVYYNQDLDVSERAAGGHKIYAPSNHFIFHLDELTDREATDPDLKKLLDKLRLQALFRYRLSGKYQKEMHDVLRSVDFTKQPFSWKYKYHAPLLLVRLWFGFRKLGSHVKRKVKGRKQHRK